MNPWLVLVIAIAAVVAVFWLAAELEHLRDRRRMRRVVPGSRVLEEGRRRRRRPLW